MCPSTDTQDSQKRGLTNFVFDKNSRKDLEKVLYSLPSTPVSSPQVTPSSSTASATMVTVNSPPPTDPEEEDKVTEEVVISSPVLPKSSETGMMNVSSGTKGDTPRRTFVGTPYRLQGKKGKGSGSPVEEKKSDPDGKDKDKEGEESASDEEETGEENTTTPTSPPQTRHNNVPSITTTNTSTNTTITIATSDVGKFKGSNKPSKVSKLHSNLGTPKKASTSKQRNFLTEAEHSWVFNATLESLHRKITKRKFSMYPTQSFIHSTS